MSRMAVVTFDTLKFVKTLQASGMPAQQAEAVADAVRDSTDAADLVTRKDLQIELQKLESKMETRFAKLEGEFMLVKWMLGLIVAGVVALVMKSFL
jgi:hypothetical protein